MKKILLIISCLIVCLAALTACEDKTQTNAEKTTATPTKMVAVTTTPKKEAKKTASSGEATITSGEESKVEEKSTEAEVTEVPQKETTKPEETKKVAETETPQKTESGKKSEYTIIKFSDMYEIKGTNKNVSTMLKNLNGKKVQIKGYPASYSPLDESFVYLNNQPFVTCPFCTIGDTTKLEVIPIFMANKSKIKYTENVINVTGTLEVSQKTDSEGYTTQFRIYADKVEEIKDDNSNKEVIEYYKNLTQAGMIYDIQTLQMNIEYVSNPQFMTYYGATKKEAVNNMIVEYLGFDEQYGGSYLAYVKECPDIVKVCEPTGNEKLTNLNNELIELYNKEIVLLEKWQNIIYKYKDSTIDDKAANDVYNTLLTLNKDNLNYYNEFTTWNNRLREE